MTTLSLYHTREEWLAARGIGASEVAAILGLSRFAKPFDVYARHRLGHVTPDNEQMAQGRAWERAILAYYEDAEDVEVVQPRTVEAEGWSCARVGAEWATCSPDGLVLRSSALDYGADSADLDVLYGVEAKRSQTPKEWGEPGDVKPGDPIPMPEAYYLQCQWSMLVTGVGRWDLIVSVYGDAKVYRVYADASLQSKLYSKVSEWRDRYIVGQGVPDVDGSAGADLYLRESFPRGEGLRVAAPEEVVDAMAYKQIGEAIKEMEERRKVLSQRLQLSIGDGQGIEIPGGKVSIVRSAGRETVDTKRLREEEPETYRRFARVGEPSHSIRVNVKEQ